ncbi:MAG: hypothetical protein CMO81_08650 [Waddliaceae bacterium]|nr:hypothetical protein [Waddliaceae bacterium]
MAYLRSKTDILIPIILIVCLLVMDVAHDSWRLSERFGQDALLKYNQEYLDEATDETFATFLVLSSMKSILALMRSSSTGISFIVDINVQVGQLLTSAQTVVDYGWAASMLALGLYLL